MRPTIAREDRLAMRMHFAHDAAGAARSWLARRDRRGSRTYRELRSRRNALEHCGTPQAAPACKVEVRYIYQILRALSPEQVFAQTLLGFETVQQAIEQHDDWVGINFVHAGGRLRLHARLRAAHEDGRLSALALSEGAYHAACGRTGAGAGAAGGTAVPRPRGGGNRARRAHRSRRGRDVRGECFGAAEGDGRRST